MKKTILESVLAALLLLTSCAGSTNTLFETASPESSVMEIYVYDGERITDYYISDDPIETEILDLLGEVSAKEVTAVTTADVTTPIYGFSMGTGDGEGLMMAWSNGNLYNRDGTVYEFDFDFAAVLDKYEFSELWSGEGILSMPCARSLVLDENGWNKTLLSVAEEKVAPDGIELEITYDGDGQIHAVYRNNGTEEWDFGEYYSLQASLDGEWYTIPTTSEMNWGFIDIGYMLESGGEWETTYNLEMYGELPAGLYRISAYGLTAEFTVE